MVDSSGAVDTMYKAMLQDRDANTIILRDQVERLKRLKTGQDAEIRALEVQIKALEEVVTTQAKIIGLQNEALSMRQGGGVGYVFPWNRKELAGWMIEACSHLWYGVRSARTRRLFVSMSKQGRSIRAEGVDEAEVFDLLAEEAARVDAGEGASGG